MTGLFAWINLTALSRTHVIYYRTKDDLTVLCDTYFVWFFMQDGFFSPKVSESTWVTFLTPRRKLIIKPSAMDLANNYFQHGEKSEVCEKYINMIICNTGCWSFDLTYSISPYHLQYYVTMGGSRFVDLGLGTQRVKCEVDSKFRYVHIMK